MAFTPTDDFVATCSNHHYGDVSVEDTLYLPDDASLRIGSYFHITASELKQLLNYLKSIHPEAFI